VQKYYTLLRIFFDLQLFISGISVYAAHTDVDVS